MKTRVKTLMSPISSTFCKITTPSLLFSNIILSFLFIIMIMTEADFSSQQKISLIVTKLFDETEYANGKTRLDITSGEEIYEYM